MLSQNFTDSECGAHWLHPFTCLVAGPTFSGKSVFVRRLISSDKIQPPPVEIYWCYGEAQPQVFSELEAEWAAEHPDRKIYFVNGFTDEVQRRLNENTSIPKLVIIDDLMQSAGSCKSVAQIFIQGSHHRNISVVYIIQNLFDRGSQSRTISLNCHYLVVFKNPRDRSQVMVLSRQMFPNNARVLSDAFFDATSRPFGYLCLNLKPTTNEGCRLQTNILDDEGPTIVYVPASGCAGI